MIFSTNSFAKGINGSKKKAVLAIPANFRKSLREIVSSSAILIYCATQVIKYVLCVHSLAR